MLEAGMLENIQVEDDAIMDVHDIPASKQKQIDQEELFYAVATESNDPITDWKQANEELLRTGESSLYKVAQDKWIKEQDNTAKAVITQLMIDPTVSDYEKQAYVNTYISGGFIQQSLRDKYLMSQAAVDNSIVELDRQAQDIIAANLKQREQQANEEDAKKALEEAEISFSDVAKGLGGVGSAIVMTIPAGYKILWSLIKDKNPEKADKILQEMQQAGYTPDDPGAQKVMSKIQEAAEFLDIPFKWIGDKAFEMTGSPAAGAAAYTASSLVGYYGAYKGVQGAVKGVRKRSPLGTTQTANPQTAAQVATAAIVDPTGELARALGTTKEAIISDYTLSKLTQDLSSRPDLMDALVSVDKRLSGLYEETRIDPNIYPKTALDADKAKYVAVMTQSTGPKLLNSQSVLDFEFTEQGTFLKGNTLFGRDSNFGYTTEIAAEYAANQLRQNVANLPEVGKISVISKQTLGPHVPPEYFVNWEFKYEYQPLDHLTMGEDALQAHFFKQNWDITKAANSLIGSWLWPAYMRMKTWIPSIGQKAGWKQTRIEQEYLNAQKDLVFLTKHKKELNQLLLDGETQGKVFNLAEVQARFPNLSRAEAENLFASYYGYRRIEDHLYTTSDRKYRYNLEKDGYKTLYDESGNKLGFASSVIKLDEQPKLVWDFKAGQAVQYTPNTPLIKLRDSVRVIDDYYEYALLGRNQLGAIKAGSLPKIPGYISRQYKEWYVLEREPIKASLNGKALPTDELKKHRQAVAMGASKAEIEKLQQDFQQNYPDSKFIWRKERKDIEDKIMFDSKIYDTVFREHQHRGQALRGLNRQANTEDVLVAQTRSIMSLSRLEAWGQYMEHSRKEWVRSYGEFSNHKFPDKVTDIDAANIGRKLTPEDETKFLAAKRVYEQLELQQFHSLASDEIWKGALHSVADVMEKTFIKSLAPNVRELGQKGMLPVRAAKALGSHMWLYTRPLRMWIVQPQQMKELALLDPKAGVKMMQEALPLLTGMLARARTLSPLKDSFDGMGRKVVPDYDVTIEAMTKSGVMQAVDTNQMVHGIWKDSLEELVKSKPEAVYDAVKKLTLAPSKVGRSIGYDPSELLNQVTLWVWSKHRWINQNPGKDWTLPEHTAQIGQLAGRMGHIASTRAGLMPFQEGMLSLLAQFVAIPHKSFMMMVSHPDLTALDKTKLLASRLFWYGKWGIPGGAAMYAWLEKEMPEETAENLDKYVRGASDFVANETLSIITGDKSDSYWSKSTSTVPESLFHWDLVMSLADMAQGEKPSGRFPFANATNSWFQAANDVYQMYNSPTLRGDDPNWTKIVWHGVRFVTLTPNGTLKDIESSLLLEGMTKTGQTFGHEKTTGEAYSELFGVKTAYEEIIWDMQKTKGKREKFIQDEAKKIHETAIMLQTKVSTEERAKYWETASAFLSTIPEEYSSDIIQEIKKLDRQRQTTIGESLTFYILNKYRAENDGYMNELRNKLKQTQDPNLTKANEVLQ